MVGFNRWRKRFQIISADERDQLLRSASVSFGTRGDQSGLTVLARALELVREFPAAGREADRSLASVVAGGRRHGIDFEATKAVIRGYRLYRRMRAMPARRYAEALRTSKLRGPGTLLLSNPMFLDTSWHDTLGPDTGLAFICHDLIPTQRPDLTISQEHARRFRDSLNAAIGRNATPLCASDTVGSAYLDHIAAAAPAAAPPRRFPMPSVLHEMALTRGRAHRVEAERPFVLYCSTVEVRKNHLMLARIWLRALREGRKLPRLVCVGKPGWGIEPLNRYLAGNSELRDLVVFTGPLGDDELIEHYRSASFGVFPSHMEGWGFSASECLDFGVPVIVSKAPALVEATRNLMPAIDADDEDAWYEAICRMAGDEAFRHRLALDIRHSHRPTPACESWAAIKAVLLEEDRVDHIREIPPPAPQRAVASR